MKSYLPPHRHQPEAVEIELIRSLFLAFLPSAVMSIGFAAVGTVILFQHWDMLLAILLAIGMIASAARLLTAWRLAPAAAQNALSLAQARQLERRFAIPYLSFSAILGLFGLRVFLLPMADLHMLTVTLLIGYCAGVAVGMGMRLWIAVPAIFISTTPAAIVALWSPDPIYKVMSALIAALLISGTHSLRARQERSAKDIGLRLIFANLARKDALTAMPNRIALREWYDERIATGSGHGLIAVHYIDLNDFKPVNDSFGHPVGDSLLIMVGKRIAHAIRETDMAARLGGDEFAIIQFGIARPAEAAMLANRLADAIAQPFRIGDRTITISTGLGYVIADGRNDDLDHLLSLADEALYASKRGDCAVAQYDAVEPIQQRGAA